MIKKYLKETAKYLLRCYPVIRTYIKRVDAMYEMSNEELKKRNEERFCISSAELTTSLLSTIDFIQKQVSKRKILSVWKILKSCL